MEGYNKETNYVLENNQIDIIWIYERSKPNTRKVANDKNSCHK